MTMLVFGVLVQSVLPLGLVSAPEAVSRTATPNAAIVAVEVEGVESDEGQIVVALFPTAEGFPQDVSEAAYTASAPIQDGAASVTVDGVDTGRYAVVAFHDADGNGEVGTNWIGMPNEGVAATNWTGGRPQFDESVTQIGAGTTAVSLTLRYL
jgi:uncharacterized protein (DUF2141 family)